MIDNIGNSVEIAKIVDARWGRADDSEKRQLVGLMATFESEYWSKYLYAAERGELLGANIILEHKDDLTDSIGRGIADHDGTIDVHFDKQYYMAKLSALAQYAAKYLIQGK